MAYQSLYRKYRSQTFNDLIGQDHVVRTLRNAIASGRIAQAYLFTGPRGTGKTSTARLLAKALCAENGPTPNPSDDDPICREIAAGTFVDVVEIDAASESGVDDIRETIVETAEYRPMIARYKVFIIDEVHDLSRQAFDALLKTIEEPPPHLIFILATTEYNKVPPTIRSRCQKYEFHRASMGDLVDRLTYVAKSEGVEAEPAALTAIARMADGGYRDALTLLEQAILTTDGLITRTAVYDQLGLVPEEVVDRLLVGMQSGDVPAIMDSLAEVAQRGRDPRALLESLMHRLADLTRAAYGVDAGGSDSAREAAVTELAARLGRDTVIRLRSRVAEAHKELRDVTLPRIWLEAELIRIATERSVSAPAGPAVVAAAPVVVAPRETVRETPRGEDPPREVAAVSPDAPARAGSRRMPAEGTASAPASGKSADLEAVLEGLPISPATPPTKPDLGPDPVVAVWPQVREEALAKSKALGMKLEGSRAFREGGLAVVELTRQTFRDWFDGKPAAAAALREMIGRRTGEELGLDLRVVAGPGPNLGVDEGTVELSLEGNALLRRAEEILNGNSEPLDGAV